MSQHHDTSRMLLPDDSVTLIDMACSVCGEKLALLYESTGSAISSAALLRDGSMRVGLCTSCGHVQTVPTADLQQYYAADYQFYSASAEEDDLCSTPDGAVAYRSERQAQIVEMLLDLSTPKRILDFGSGKARTLRLLCERHATIEPFVFDVSDTYREHWDVFTARDHQASFTLPDSWGASFDAVLSFFALEHVEEPVAFAKTLRGFLRPGGKALVIVPDMYENISDMIVTDHINHFSKRSLVRVFLEAGFSGATIDSTRQPGWSIVLAEAGHPTSTGDSAEPADQQLAARDIARRWIELAKRVREAERRFGGSERSAIYGSGVYGLFLASSLEHRERLSSFIDRNPFRQGLRFFDVPVIDPSAVADDVGMVYVGLNPLYARRAIAECLPLSKRQREYFFV